MLTNTEFVLLSLKYLGRKTLHSFLASVEERYYRKQKNRKEGFWLTQYIFDKFFTAITTKIHRHVYHVYSVFCPGFQKGRVPSEKGTFSAVNGPSKGHN